MGGVVQGLTYPFVPTYPDLPSNPSDGLIYGVRTYGNQLFIWSEYAGYWEPVNLQMSAWTSDGFGLIQADMLKFGCTIEIIAQARYALSGNLKTLECNIGGTTIESEITDNSGTSALFMHSVSRVSSNGASGSLETINGPISINTTVDNLIGVLATDNGSPIQLDVVFVRVIYPIVNQVV